MRDSIIKNSLSESFNGLQNLISDQKAIENIAKAAELISNTLKDKGTIFSCGNGGSMCDAMHFAEELSGRYREDRKPLSAISISDVSSITCIANDFGFENIFSRFLEANAKDHDLLIAISTSGNSKNIINACKYCIQNDIKLITLTGKRDSFISKLSDVDICTPSGKFSDRVQELHGIVIHIMVELVEEAIFVK